MAGDEKSFTQEQVDAMIAERIASEVATAVAGLKKNRDELAREAKEAKAKLQGLDGIDPDEFRTLKADREKAEQDKLAAEGNWKQLEAQLLKRAEGEKQQLSKKYDGELETERQRATRMQSAMESYLIDSAAVTELAPHSDSPKLLLPHIRSQMKVVEHEGRYVSRIVDENGNVRIGKGAGAAPMTLPELIEEMKQDKTYAGAFKGTGSSGGGASKSTGGAGGAVTRIAAPVNGVFGADFLNEATLKGVAGGTIAVDR